MIIMTKEQKIKDILLKLELELKDRDMWGGDERRPHESALNSKEPFCIDTLEFHQWLEYILIKKMHQIIDEKQELPGSVQIYPMAVEYYRGQWGEYRSLIDILRQFDEIFT